MSAARQGYASARVQARFSRRPAPHDFRLLDASRSIAHLQDALRQGPLARFVAGLGPSPGSDDFEARLRDAWREACAEVSRWHATEWASAFLLFDACADLAGLELLRAGGPAPVWLQSDDRLGPVAHAGAASRATAVRTTYGTPLAVAFEAAAPLSEAWRRAWIASWPPVSRPVAKILAGIADLCLEPRVADERRLEERTGRLERLLNRGRGTPAAAFAYLAILAIALERIRGSRAALLVPDDAPS